MFKMVLFTIFNVINAKNVAVFFQLIIHKLLKKRKKRHFALAMYLEGLGFHSIGMFIGSHTKK